MSLWIFCLPVLLTTEDKVLKFPNITVDLFMLPFTFISFLFLYFEYLLFGVQYLGLLGVLGGQAVLASQHDAQYA